MKIRKKNKKTFAIIGGVIVVLVAGFYAYKKGLLSTITGIFQKKTA